MSTSGPTGVAVVLQRVVPLDGVNTSDLEKFILQELFPSVDTSSADLTPDTHFLLNDDPEYLWMSRLEYPIHATPVPTWLLDRITELKELASTKLSAMATITSANFYYDVGAWRGILGF